MLKKHLLSNKGSTLVLVIITLSVLGLLGTTIISAAVVGFKTKISERNVKTALYLSEAGLEEAYAEIGKVVENALTASNQYVEAELDGFIEEERLKIFEDPTYNSPYLNDDDTVNEQAIKDKLQEWFNDRYASYINSSLFSALSSKVSSNNFRVVDDAVNFSRPTITVYDVDASEEENKRLPFPVDASALFIGNRTNDRYKITLNSTFNHKGVLKELKVRFEIAIPDYNAPYYVKREWAELEENVLWTKAITTDKDLFVKSTNTTINGDVFAYGTRPSIVTDTRSYGGIVVGHDSMPGNITIHGDIATNSYVHTNTSNSQLIIQGNVFCDSLLIEEDTDNSRISITGSVHTRDDLELNGRLSHINIAGNYYGFSDGSAYARSHDNSSSIIINSPDIGEVDSVTGNLKSMLKITGDAYLGGTAYIPVESGYYQTGESVSVKGNYRAYFDPLNPSPSGERPEEFKSPFEFKSFPPLYLVNEFYSPDTEKPLLAKDKGQYFQYFNEDFPGQLTLGGNGIDIGGVRFSTGAYINNGEIFPSHQLIEDFLILGQKHDLFKNQVDKMNDPTERGSGPVHINHRFKFETDVLPSQEDKDRKEIALVNTGSQPIRILGDGVINHSPSDPYTLQLSKFKGVILTKGDVHISGEVDFWGTIIAEGDIYIEDNHRKSLNYDEAFIRRKVYETPALKEQFKKNGAPVKFLVESTAGVDDVNSYIKYENIIRTYWYKIR
ncbi:hypothetical protein [Anaerosolibacter sp.]|uniref:hypothetical protein n=1 Tax=Anaerosolibacter sp. TaxID=1872527 RepID=UPI0039EF99A3